MEANLKARRIERCWRQGTWSNDKNAEDGVSP